MDRGIDLLTGLIAAALVVVLARRVILGWKSGEIALYRTRVRRSDMGEGKFGALILFNVAVMIGMAVIAADLLLGLGLRG